MFTLGNKAKPNKSTNEREEIEDSFLQSVEFIISSMRCRNGTCFWDSINNTDTNIFSTYIMVWALSKMDLMTEKLKYSVASWVINNRQKDLLWYKDNGYGGVDSTARALIILILTEYIHKFDQVELYVNWLISKQNEVGGWPSITHEIKENSLGVTLVVTFLFNLILNNLYFENMDKKEDINNSLKKATSFAHKKFQTIKNSRSDAREIKDIAWILRVYYNCMPDNYSKEDEINADIEIGLQQIETWLQKDESWMDKNSNSDSKYDNIDLIYNCLWSYALHKDQIDISKQYLKKGLWFMINYVKRDKSIIAGTRKNKRHIGAFILCTFSILEKENTHKHTLLSVKEKAKEYEDKINIKLFSRQVSYHFLQKRNLVYFYFLFFLVGYIAGKEIININLDSIKNITFSFISTLIITIAVEFIYRIFKSNYKYL